MNTRVSAKHRINMMKKFATVAVFCRKYDNVIKICWRIPSRTPSTHHRAVCHVRQRMWCFCLTSCIILVSFSFFPFGLSYFFVWNQLSPFWGHKGHRVRFIYTQTITPKWQKQRKNVHLHESLRIESNEDAVMRNCNLGKVGYGRFNAEAKHP